MTRRQDRRAGPTTHGAQVLRRLEEALAATTEALAAGPASPRAEAAVARLEEARRALLPLLRTYGPAVSAPTPVGPAPRVLQTEQLPPNETASRLARAFCRSALSGWCLADPAAEAAVDVSSELVTNAARSATGPVELRLERLEDALVVSVWDDGPGRPQLLSHRPGTSDRGIGLHWVQSLATAWGWTDERGGKRVWAVLPLPPHGGSGS